MGPRHHPVCVLVPPMVLPTRPRGASEMAINNSCSDDYNVFVERAGA